MRLHFIESSAFLRFFDVLLLVFTSSQGRKIKCSTSQAKHKLFIGNVPKDWTLEDMEKVVRKVGPGINSVELLQVNTD